MYPSFAAFVPIAALLIVVPGPDVLLVVRNAARGRSTGIATAAGTVSGLMVHATAATVGLSALVAASARAFLVVKVIGAGYLVALGIHALWANRRRAPATDRHNEPPRPAAVPVRMRVAFRQGVLTNVLNPKVAVFFVAFLPQFLPTGGSAAAGTLMLAGVFIAMTAGYLLGLVAVTVRAAGLLARPVVRRWMDRVAGAVFVGFGVRLALQPR